MFFFQHPGHNQKIPWTTKVSLVLWILFGLFLLSFFAFSFFIIAILVGVVLFTVNLFQRQRTPISRNTQKFQTRTYTGSQKQKEDDNIIDI
jgi:fatty acid desaturase